ncbi:MAG: malate synthase G, partial [Brevundimonas sp.]|nr:malate synthase G [Brevundimonas sp.]
MPVRADLTVAPVLAAFLEEEVLPGLGMEAAGFWQGVRTLLDWAVPENRRLLAVRDDLQARIDSWHRDRKGQPYDVAAQRDVLKQIGWLVDGPAPFAIGTRNVDAEIATRAGPQLVVPVLNARFVLNAANARWGSLYDALYGTDALGDLPPPGGYDADRGARVVA